jgi:hypothetical protein
MRRVTCRAVSTRPHRHLLHNSRRHRRVLGLRPLPVLVRAAQHREVPARNGVTAEAFTWGLADNARLVMRCQLIQELGVKERWMTWRAIPAKLWTADAVVGMMVASNMTGTASR